MGATYNFMNPTTQYRSGIDGHLDWGISRFVSPQVQLGIAGYVFEQLSDDNGAGARLGGFRSQVVGVGPQAGYIVTLGSTQVYLGLRGYYEFEAQNRPEGWNVFFTVALSPAAKH